jgi:Tol biopolymer transport system component
VAAQADSEDRSRGVAAPHDETAPGQLAYFADSNDFSDTSTITLGLADGSGENRRTVFRNAKDAFGFPASSPAGAKLACFTAVGPKGGIDVINLTTRKATALVRYSGNHASFAGTAWSEDGHDVIYSSNALPDGKAA